MTSTGEGWFVNNQAGATGNGAQADPFDTLAEAVAVAGAGDTIFVSRGDGTSTGLNTDITLPIGVNLIGEGQGLILAQTVVPQGQAPVLDCQVTVLGDNTISGFIFEDPDDAIMGNGFTNVTITNNTFQDGANTETQIGLENMLGTITITDNTFRQDNDTDATALSTAGTCSVNVSSNTFELTTPTAAGDDCIQLVVNNGGNATIQWNNNTLTGSTTASSSLERGMNLFLFGDGQATLTASGNMSTLLDGSAIHIDLLGTSMLTATITGNAFDQNLVMSSPVVDVSTNSSNQATIVFDNNSVTDSAGLGMRLLASASSSLNIALRNNTITGTADDAVIIDAGNSSNLCAEITGNTFGADLNFSDQTSGNFDVEQFGNAMGDVLATLNTFTSGGITVTNGTVTSVADGACLIP
jgi:trimeric autotransporter adhesin